MTDFISDTVTGACQRLDAQGIGDFTPSLGSDEPGAGSIYDGELPASVRVGIGVQGYVLGPDDPQNPTSTVRIQFLVRGASKADIRATYVAIYDAFHGLNNVAMGSVMVTDCTNLSMLPLGPDGNGDQELTANFRFDLDLQSSALRSY